MATKILVAGDVTGDLDALFSRVATVNSSHGPFACLLCVGDFLGKPEDAVALLAPFKAGEREAPLPTYFLGPPGGALPSEVLASTDAGGLVAPGITCLGAAGIHVLSGLKVAFISGAQRDAEQLPPNGVAELKRLSQLPGAAVAPPPRSASLPSLATPLIQTSVGSPLTPNLCRLPRRRRVPEQPVAARLPAEAPRR